MATLHAIARSVLIGDLQRLIHFLRCTKNIHLVGWFLPNGRYSDKSQGHGGVAQIFTASRARCRRKSEAQLADFRLPSWDPAVLSVLG
jgi:hypothetical protein